MRMRRVGMIWLLRAAASAMLILSFRAAANRTSQSIRFPSGECSAGRMSACETIVFPFPVQNCASHPIRIVCAAGICRTPGCVSVRDFPMTIPALSTRLIPLEVHAGEKYGPFRLETKIFTDCPGQTQIGVAVSGVVTRKQRVQQSEQQMT